MQNDPQPMDADEPEDMFENKRVACVAVIGQNNGLLYLRSYPEVAQTTLPNRLDGDAGMMEVIYNSLDVIEERLASLKEAQPKDVDNFLGCLAVVGTLSLFGQVTNSRQKLIVVIKTAGGGVSDSKEPAVRTLFRRLHIALVHALLNPFADPGEPIRSVKFDKQVDTIAREYE